MADPTAPAAAAAAAAPVLTPAPADKDSSAATSAAPAAATATGDAAGSNGREEGSAAPPAADTAGTEASQASAGKTQDEAAQPEGGLLITPTGSRGRAPRAFDQSRLSGRPEARGSYESDRGSRHDDNRDRRGSRDDGRFGRRGSHGSGRRSSHDHGSGRRSSHDHGSGRRSSHNRGSGGRHGRRRDSASRQGGRYEDDNDYYRRHNRHVHQYRDDTQPINAQDRGVPLERILRTDFPRAKYYSRPARERSVNHWGQRKLLLSEIEFLTQYGHLSSKVVYAGAAPGAKNAYLVSLFPNHTFEFVDPNPFHKVLKDAANRDDDIGRRITLVNDFFTNERADALEGQTVLFISDIRTADANAMGQEEVEDAIVGDNNMQMEWHFRMQPAASMLKFRLPWGAGSTKYLAGSSPPVMGDRQPATAARAKIYFPVWGRQTTTETRLVAMGDKLEDYDHTVYEEQLFHFNTVTRVLIYKHRVPTGGSDAPVPGLCRCYDCAAEVRILEQWAKAFPERWFDYDGEPTDPDITGEVIRMCNRLSQECATSGNRDLSVVIGHGQKWFKPKRFDTHNRKVVEVAPLDLDPNAIKYTRDARGADNSAAAIRANIRKGSKRHYDSGPGSGGDDDDDNNNDDNGDDAIEPHPKRPKRDD